MVKNSSNEDSEVTSEVEKELQALNNETQNDDNKPTQTKSAKKQNGMKRFWHFYRTKKKITIPLTIVLLVAITLAIPLSRYAVLGLFIKKDVSVIVLDDKTNKPVSGADVSLAGITAKTDGEGKALLEKVRVGEHNLQVKKTYYKQYDKSVVVDGIGETDPSKVSLEATGRQVELSVVNKISGKNIAGVLIKSGKSEAKTNAKGLATIVVSPNAKNQKAQLTSAGFLDTQVSIAVDNKSANNFSLTPSGRVYFLSKRSGTIDVVKTNLDGTDRQVVLAGTGQEEEQNTVLLGTRDWKYQVLLSRRDSTQPKLYLIDTATDKESVIDEGDASFTITGWHDHDFVYTVTRNQVPFGQPKRQALKVFHASSSKLNTLDETIAPGGAPQEIGGGVSLVDQGIVYVKQWLQGYAQLGGQQTTINLIGYDGSNKKELKSLSPVFFIQELLFKPNNIYFSYYNNQQNYLEYEDGNVREVSDQSQKFNVSYPTYLLSPSGNYSLWSEQRDGKNTLFVGNKDGNDGKLIDQATKYNPYGWYGDDYILVSLDGSELYIAPREFTKGSTYLKVTDYHKPALNFLGYGGGYGGL